MGSEASQPDKQTMTNNKTQGQGYASQQYTQQAQQSMPFSNYAQNSPQGVGSYQGYMQANQNQYQGGPLPSPQSPQYNAVQLQFSQNRYSNSHLNNLQRLIHISASNPQLNNGFTNQNQNLPSKNTTPTNTPKLPSNETFLKSNKNLNNTNASNNNIFNFQNIPSYTHMQDQFNNEALKRSSSLSRHVSETNIYQVLRILKLIFICKYYLYRLLFLRNTQ